MIPSKDIHALYAQIGRYWYPHVVESLNGQEVKIAKVKGTFDWHSHEQEDELFIVWKGTLYIELREGTVRIPTGHMHLIPRGQEHRPYTADEEEVWIMMLEPAGTLNTGDKQTDKTVAAPPRLD